MTPQGKLILLWLLMIALPCFAAEQAQTQKNQTKKHTSSKMLFEPSSYDKTTVVLTKGKEWKYYQFTGEKPLVLEIEGTTVLYFRIRILYDATMKGSQNFTLAMQEQGLLGMKSDVLSYSFKAKKSSVSTVKNEPQLVPSAAHEFKFTVPDGKHQYFFTLKGTSARIALMRVLIHKSDLLKEAEEE